MKFIILALGAEALRLSDVSGVDCGANGHIKQCQPSHWRQNWPEGAIDDSTDDDKIMNWVRLPEGPAGLASPPIKYHDKMRHWEAGSWPVHFTWSPDYTHATYHKQIDDGTDDNEVVDLMYRQHDI